MMGCLFIFRQVQISNGHWNSLDAESKELAENEKAQHFSASVLLVPLLNWLEANTYCMDLCSKLIEFLPLQATILEPRAGYYVCPGTQLVR